MDVLVPESFRDLALSLFPALVTCAAFRHLFCRLLFSPRLDEETGGVLVSRFALAADEDATSDALSRHYSGLGFLKRFKDQVFDLGGLTFGSYRYIEGRCRTAIVQFPEPLVLGRDRVLRGEVDGKLVSFVTGKLVSFVTGKPESRWTRTELRRLQREEAGVLQTLCGNEATSEMMTYLNGLPSNGFASVGNHIEDAREHALTITDEGQRNSLLCNLKKIEAQPVPVYAPSRAGKSDRLFGLNGGLTAISRGARDILCQDWHHADLKYAQLAIVARLWDTPELDLMLEEVKSIWPLLAGHLGIDNDDMRFPEVKAGIKELVYATIFGMTRANLNRKASALLGGLVEDPNSILKHRVFKILLKSRTRYGKELKDAGYATTCFGKVVPIDSNADLRSALAQQAQAVEVSLMQPLYELAAKTRDFKVMLHLHDGVYLSFARREPNWCKRISKAVDENAKRLGIRTGLEWTDPLARSKGPGHAGDDDTEGVLHEMHSNSLELCETA